MPVEYSDWPKEFIASMMNEMQNEFIVPSNSEVVEYWIHSDLSRIIGLSCQWDELLTASRCNQAFGSPEWYLASCHFYGPLKPYLAVAARGPKLVCILPLELDLRNGVVTFPHRENDYNDILVRDGDLGTAAGLLEYAMSPKNLCRRMILSKLKPDSDCVRAAALLGGRSKIVCEAHDIGRIYRYIKLPATFDEYLASRSTVLRKRIRQTLRSINADGLTMTELQPETFDSAQLAGLFMSMALARQKQKSFLHAPQTQAFVREVLSPLFIKRRLRPFVLMKGDQIVAINMSMVYPNGLITWNGGFLEEATPWSPGTALLAFSIKELIAMGLSEYDFGEGDEAYKKHWTDSEYRISTMELVSKLSV
jgi:CelD/BcsL family acetyltransferase involved in cellulose biosynthesis